MHVSRSRDKSERKYMTSSRTRQEKMPWFLSSLVRVCIVPPVFWFLCPKRRHCDPTVRPAHFGARIRPYKRLWQRVDWSNFKLRLRPRSFIPYSYFLRIHMNMKIRTGRESDIDGLVGVINDAFRIEKFFVDGDRINKDEVLRMLGRGSFLLAESADDSGAPALLGCVYVEPRGDRSYLGLLSVASTTQGKGIGSKLMVAAESHAFKAGSRFMDLRVVNVRDTLVHYYGRLGYEKTSTEPFPAEVPTKLPCHFIVMSKALGNDTGRNSE